MESERIKEDPEISWFEWGLLIVIFAGAGAFIATGIATGIAHLAGWAS